MHDDRIIHNKICFSIFLLHLFCYHLGHFDYISFNLHRENEITFIILIFAI